MTDGIAVRHVKDCQLCSGTLAERDAEIIALKELLEDWYTVFALDERRTLAANTVADTRKALAAGETAEKAEKA